MALVGNIKDFGLSDFLYLVDRGYKTGGLHLSHEQETALLFFDKGKLIMAARKPEDQQADLLVRLGLLNGDQLDQARQSLSTQGNGATLTQVIVDSQIASREQIQSVLQGFTEESVYGLFGWPEGEFRFEQNQRPAPDAPVVPIPISVDHLIMEGVRRIDEWGRIKDRIPSTDMIVRFLEQPDERAKGVKLAPEEWRIFARINGKDTLAEIARKTSLSEFDVCRIVYGFLTAGLVEVRKKPPVAVGRSAADAPRVKKSLVNRIINRIKGM
ncbi:MAG: DUF4388 domain-containing protein [Candidatus Viridilinea halotolerans]|uniref:DUF4388 domain-containing protein n=1 Tax=Candidatus Viridilinea halotolerans TaxID=2491704 RepID=A0A426UCG0_9CHLR|nr:MAG: DUF4388 domain-containing protein [Candidatus Viridilinea halotolerans]